MDELSKEYLLAKLKDIIEDKDISIKDKLTAIKMAGGEVGMFAKQVNVDIRKLIAQLNVEQLEGMTRHDQLTKGNSPSSPMGSKTKLVGAGTTASRKPRRKRN